MALIRKLYKDGDYRFSLLIGCGCFFGLRISDLLKLAWSMLLDDESFLLNEQKTGKRRIVKINKSFQRHIQDCYDALTIPRLCRFSRTSGHDGIIGFLPDYSYL